MLSEKTHMSLSREEVRLFCPFLSIYSGFQTNSQTEISFQCIDSKDSLAKHVYSALFDWIVAKINKAVSVVETNERSIGILDMFGYENTISLD